MKDFSPAMKCLGAEIWQMDMTPGPEAVVSCSVSKGFFHTYGTLCIAEDAYSQATAEGNFSLRPFKCLLGLLSDQQNTSPTPLCRFPIAKLSCFVQGENGEGADMYVPVEHHGLP